MSNSLLSSTSVSPFGATTFFITVIEPLFVFVKVQVTSAPRGTSIPETVLPEGEPLSQDADVKSQDEPASSSVTEYDPALTSSAPVVPVRPDVVMSGVEGVGPLTVKMKVPLPPTVFFTIVRVPGWSSFVILQSVESDSLYSVGPPLSATL